MRLSTKIVKLQESLFEHTDPKIAIGLADSLAASLQDPNCQKIVIDRKLASITLSMMSIFVGSVGVSVIVNELKNRGVTSEQITEYENDIEQ